MSELPKGWDYQDVGSFNNHKGKNIKPSDFPDEVFEVFSVPTFASGKPEYLKGSDIGSSKQVVQSGDVLVCKINPRINRVWVVPTKGNYRQIASSEWINVRNEEFDSRYLKYAFTSQSFRDLICSEVTGVGGSLTRAQPKKVAGYKIPVAPIHEQKRIADKLDSVLAKVEAAQARLDKIPAILKRFRQSVLAAAISGELTKEWRERQSNLISPLALVADKRNKLLADGTIKPSKQNSAEPIENENTSVHYSWKYSRLISICSLITDGKHGNCKDESNSGYYFLSAKDIKGGELIYENSRQINKYEFQEVHNRTNLEPLDICIVNTGATVGKLALAPFSAKTQKTTFQKSVAVVKVIKPFIVPQYVAIVFEEANKRLLKSSTGTAVNNLLLSTMKQLIIPIPSTEEQLRIVSKVDELSEQAKAVEKQYHDAKARLDKLTQSLLAKAFKGELLSSSVEPEVTEIENSVEAIHA